MWRDRTNLFVSYRQSYAHHPSKKRRIGHPLANGRAEAFPEERRGLMSADAHEEDGDAVIEMDALPPRWIDVQGEVAEILATVTTRSASLEKLHQKHVLPGFDDEDIKQQEEREIDRLTQEITRDFHRCQRAIGTIEKMVSEARIHGALNSGEEIMANNIRIALASTVQEASASFRKKQSTYLSKLRQLGGFDHSAPLSTATVQNPYSDPSMVDSDADASFSQSTLQQTAQKRTSSNDTVIAQREQEINEIAKGIIELADIFKELQIMVIDQGTMLDRIDYNVEKLAVNVKGAETELRTATGYQRQNAKRKIILLLILLVVALFVIVLIKPKRSSQSKRSPQLSTRDGST